MYNLFIRNKKFTQFKSKVFWDYIMIIIFYMHPSSFSYVVSKAGVFNIFKNFFMKIIYKSKLAEVRTLIHIIG